jgi:hypothetical protein
VNARVEQTAAMSGTANGLTPTGAVFALNASRCCAGSGTKRSASSRFKAASPVATIPGTASPKCDAMPPIIGPKMNPNPNAAPTSPITLVR